MQFSVFADENPAKLSVNGRIIDSETYGTVSAIADDAFIIPVNAVCDMLGFSSSVNEEGNEMTVVLEESVVIFADACDYFLKDGEQTGMDVPCTVTENGMFLVSSSAISESLGLTVKYNSEKGIVSVIKMQQPKEESDSKNPLTQKKTNDKSKEFITVVHAMNQGFVVTLKLFAVTLIGALPLGLIIALCSMSKFLPLRWFTRLLVWIIRGTPLMLQLLIIFFIPGMAMEGGSPWPRGEEGRFMAASVAFIINYAFYFSEIYRGGIENIPQGQVEAGQVLGMTKTQIFFHVTLVQMIKRIVPPMSNEIITLVKDTSIARIISLQEVIWAGYAFLKSSHGYSGLLWPLFFTGVYYLLFNGILTLLFGYVEKKLSYFKA